MEPLEHVLEVENLSVVYQDSTLFGKRTTFQALTDVSFVVNHGEITHRSAPEDVLPAIAQGTLGECPIMKTNP